MRSNILLLIFMALLSFTRCAKVPPAISFQNKTANIGVLDSSRQKATIHFKFKNSGDGDLIVKNAASNCTCTIASFTKQPLHKGQWGDIAVTVNYKQIIDKGNLIRNIIVQSNTQPMLHTLTINMVAR